MKNIKLNIEEIVDGFIAEQEKRKEELNVFKREKEDIIIGKVYSLIKEGKFIDSEDLLYADKPIISSEDFDSLYELLEEYARDNYLLFSDDDMGFYNYKFTLSFNDTEIIFSQIQGQGTVVMAHSSKNQIYDKGKIFTWEQYKSNYEFDTSIFKKQTIKDELLEFINDNKSELNMTEEEVRKTIMDILIENL